MRQNFGVIFLTCGSILLGFGVFRNYIKEFIKFLDWKNVPWESKLALRFFGIKKKNFLDRIVAAYEKYPLGKELKDLTLAERFYLNLPVYAIILMAIGLFLCLDYRAFLEFMKKLKTIF